MVVLNVVLDMLVHYAQAYEVMQVYEMMQLTVMRVWLRKMSLMMWLVITIVLKVKTVLT